MRDRPTPTSFAARPGLLGGLEWLFEGEEGLPEAGGRPRVRLRNCRREWPYPDEPWSPDKPEAAQFRCLDCSGYVRMLWGFRRHRPNPGPLGALPLSHNIKPGHLPRRAFQMSAAAPGVVIVPNEGVQVTDFAKLAIGDLVFFKADEDDQNEIDHVGISLGKDGKQRPRFISSRKSANGPTLADHKNSDGELIRSVLDGHGHYARSFRAVRRL